MNECVVNIYCRGDNWLHTNMHQQFHATKTALPSFYIPLIFMCFFSHSHFYCRCCVHHYVCLRLFPCVSVNLYRQFISVILHTTERSNEISQKKKEKNQSDDRKEENYLLLFLLEKKFVCLFGFLHSLLFGVALSLSLPLCFCHSLYANVTLLFRLFWFCLPSFVLLAECNRCV